MCCILYMVRRGIPKFLYGIRVIPDNPEGPNLGRNGKSMSFAILPPAVELGKVVAVSIEI